MTSRRDILKLGAAFSGATLLPAATAEARVAPVFRKGGEDYSHLSGSKLKAVPTACGQCPARCAAIGYVDAGHVVKMEGNPDSARSNGKLCPRGQAGINQVYDPDRILHPLRRTGRRGDGEWETIGWDEALSDLAVRLQRLRDEGTPERFLFHHGWIAPSARALVGTFLAAYGTGSVIDDAGRGQIAKRAALELTWGAGTDSWDVGNARFILNIGSNCLEAGVNHLPVVTRLAAALAESRTTLVTVDVRLSNTAARSHRWVPIRPGTDLALVLAMCNVVMRDSLYRGAGEEFLKYCRVTPDVRASVEDKIAALKRHLAPYTPTWAERVTGIDEATIEELATAFATSGPACVISARGAAAHDNGVETERAIQMLAALTGNIDRPGARCRAAMPQWQYPQAALDNPAPRRLPLFAELEQKLVLPGNVPGHRVLDAIGQGTVESPEIYMWYGHNPAYANGDVGRSIEILKDEARLPFTVCVSPFYDESAALADLILPDTTYLERWDWEDGYSPDQVPEYYIRQPVVDPQGEARDFKDVCCELADRMGFPLGIESGKAFVAAACDLTPEVRNAGGFAEIAKRGVLCTKGAKAAYRTYLDPVRVSQLGQEGVLLDPETGVYWNWKRSGAANETEALRQGYANTQGAEAGYIGQKIGETVVAGFRPGAVGKTGYFELYSPHAAAHGLGGLPAYKAIAEHKDRAAGDLVLTTYKVSVQSQSRSQNCHWLTEVYHDNPAWINPDDAGPRGIRDGDRIKVGSGVGELETTAKVTNLVAPGVVAVSAHCGHWQFGRFASGNVAPGAETDPADHEFKWWHRTGANPNWIVPNAADPVTGQQRWMDTVVTVNLV